MNQQARTLATTHWAGFARGSYAERLALIDLDTAGIMVGEMEPDDQTRHGIARCRELDSIEAQAGKSIERKHGSMEAELRMGAGLAHQDDAVTERRLPWYVWLLTWLCTSLTGGCFGAFFMVLQGGGMRAADAGFWIGFYLAAVIGAFFVPICGLLAGLFRLRGRKSLRMMTIAGGATGLVSGVVLGPLCLLTCVCGAMGAALPGKSYLSRRGSPDHAV